MNYDHKVIEKKWQRSWEKEGIFAAGDKVKKEKKKYILDMFPYPSGAGLHVGHPEGYTATDIYSRYLRMKGYSVLHPMGWDAFGLPAENYAIKSGVHPKESTEANIKTFTRQIKSLGFSYDWSREVNTSSPDYYRWTQWLFLQLYKAGLAYKKAAPVNWCPSCQTVLANEQVVDGACERCGTAVEQKNLEQWFFRITGVDPKGKSGSYPERLLANLDSLDWPEPIKTMQRNWIGKSEGAEIKFKVQSSKFKDVNFVLLHGKGGSSKECFIPWLRKQLEEQGFRVQAPNLPHTDEPDDGEQAEFVTKNCTIDDKTIIIGHSFGGIVALRLLERGVRAGKVILVGTPFSGRFLDGKERPTVARAAGRGFDFEKIKNNAKSFTLLFDEHDHIIPMSDGQRFAENLGAPLRRVVASQPHFNAPEEPEVLDACAPSINVFTTRPDTLFGATYMVLAPEHSLVQELKGQIQNWDEVQQYVKAASAKSPLERTDLAKEKTGVELKGVAAINPGNNEEIPVWISDYVLSTYGTGAIMAVPAHDERDFEFAKKFNLPVKQVITDAEFTDGEIMERAYAGIGVLINSDEFSGDNSEEAKWKITEKVGGKRTIQYKLRDWLISRQRYWGAPIPIIYCDTCGEQAVPEKDLPVELPADVDFRPTGESPLQRSRSFHQVKCPKCGKAARRESDTMDTFVDSSWYFLRYVDPENQKAFADKKKVKAWLPVDTYVGGAEHAVLHLMYARFVYMVLYDLGFIDFSARGGSAFDGEEPFLQLRNQGLILGEDGQKMSKRWGNVINPDEVVDKFGADAMRMYEMFIGPLEDAKPWDTNGIVGVRRFLDRVWNLLELKVKSYKLKEADQEIVRELHKLIKKAGEDIESFDFNTAVSQFMIFVNTASKQGEISKEHFEIFLRVLAPFAPHLANELWEKLGHKKLIEHETWPEYNESLLADDIITYMVQVNGKVRGQVVVAAEADEDEVVKAARSDEKVAKYLSGGETVKTIFVKKRLVNFVVK